MSTDQLTTTPRRSIVSGVLAVLAGADRAHTAADYGIDPAELTDALDAFQTAGLAALDRRAEQRWYQVRIQFADWTAAEAVAVTQLGPRLTELRDAGLIGPWWFLRKHPCWRLRVGGADTSAVDRVLDDLTSAGAFTRWWPSVYEPETHAFGGPAAIDAVHDLFCADSRGVLDYLRHDQPMLGRRELSLILLTSLLTSGGLDPFERGDVFARVGQLRPLPARTDPDRLRHLASRLRLLVAIPHLVETELLASDASASVSRWLSAFQTAGYQLGGAATAGQLTRGLRAILTHVVIFHWNRLGLSAASQAILAHAATDALLPLD